MLSACDIEGNASEDLEEECKEDDGYFADEEEKEDSKEGEQPEAQQAEALQAVPGLLYASSSMSSSIRSSSKQMSRKSPRIMLWRWMKKPKSKKSSSAT